MCHDEFQTPIIYLEKFKNTKNTEMKTFIFIHESTWTICSVRVQLLFNNGGIKYSISFV